MNIRDVLFQITIRMLLLATMVHEYGHLLSLRIMGFDGAIYARALNMVYPVDIAHMTINQQYLFFFSGGMFQALIFLTLSLWDKDEENRLVNKMVVIQGVIYGLFEGLMPRMWWEFGASIALVISIAFMVIVLAKSSQDPSPVPPTPV